MGRDFLRGGLVFNFFFYARYMTFFRGLRLSMGKWYFLRKKKRGIFGCRGEEGMRTKKILVRRGWEVWLGLSVGKETRTSW